MRGNYDRSDRPSVIDGANSRAPEEPAKGRRNETTAAEVVAEVMLATDKSREIPAKLAATSRPQEFQGRELSVLSASVVT